MSPGCLKICLVFESRMMRLLDSAEHLDTCSFLTMTTNLCTVAAKTVFHCLASRQVCCRLVSASDRTRHRRLRYLAATRPPNRPRRPRYDASALHLQECQPASLLFAPSLFEKIPSVQAAPQALCSLPPLSFVLHLQGQDPRFVLKSCCLCVNVRLPVASHPSLSRSSDTIQISC